MGIDKAKAFAGIKPLFGKFLQEQVDGIDTILDEWAKRGLTDLRWLAYMLATTQHETASTMQPIEEYGKGKGRVYGKPDPVTGKTYYGRGYVQLTWKANYDKAGRIVGVDLVTHPDLAMVPETAVKILFDGMIAGWFTGKALRHYFTPTLTDWVGARRIINGNDKADKIAAKAIKYHAALKAAVN